MDIAQVPLGRIISGSFVTITLGMHDPREPERARKGPKGPDEASLFKQRSYKYINDILETKALSSYFS